MALECMHNDLTVIHGQLEAQGQEKEAAKKECIELEQDLTMAHVQLQKVENE